MTGHLDHQRFTNLLYLDIKSSIPPVFFFDLLCRYKIRYRIHSFDPVVVNNLQKEKDCLPFEIEIGYASETGQAMQTVVDYLVFPKECFKPETTTIPVCWYTFKTLYEAKVFMSHAPEHHDCFVDYLL